MLGYGRGRRMMPIFRSTRIRQAFPRWVEAWELDRSMEAPAIGKLGCAGTSWLNFSITSSIYSIRPTPSVTHRVINAAKYNGLDARTGSIETSLTTKASSAALATA